MENQDSQKPAPLSSFEEMKIYTPRYASQMQQEWTSMNLLDQAPVRIYERPIRTDPFIADVHHEIG